MSGPRDFAQVDYISLSLTVESPKKVRPSSTDQSRQRRPSTLTLPGYFDEAVKGFRTITITPPWQLNRSCGGYESHSLMVHERWPSIQALPKPSCFLSSLCSASRQDAFSSGLPVVQSDGNDDRKWEGGVEGTFEQEPSHNKPCET